jgi:light-regulated signal transduction histidine kinase (bacteriophytochrome)
MNEPDDSQYQIENDSGAAHESVLRQDRGAANDRCAQDGGDDSADLPDRGIGARQIAEALEDVETFTHAASQDMRAPMRQVRAYVALILSAYSDALPNEAARMLQRIDGVARRMDALLKGIVDLSGVSRRTPKFDWCDLGALAASVLERLERPGAERRVALQVEPSLRVRADARLVRLLLEALIGNAYKFSMHVEHPEIAIGRTERDGKSWYFVRDNGAGFDMRYADRLFEPFHRLHSQREFEGIGLGLATARRIVERHGGSIRAESEPGKGATISFTLD